jgi:hypothetical protein
MKAVVGHKNVAADIDVNDGSNFRSPSTPLILRALLGLSQLVDKHPPTHGFGGKVLATTISLSCLESCADGLVFVMIVLSCDDLSRS